MENKYYVYILLCKNNGYYTGSTNDVLKRFIKHKKGRGAKYTKLFIADKIVIAWELENKSIALSLEHFIKSVNREAKLKFIENTNILKKCFSKKKLSDYKIKKVPKSIINKINKFDIV